MNILLIIFGVLGGIILIVLVIAAMGKDDFTIVSTINIHKPKQVVYDYLKLLKNGEQYNKWVQSDPNMRKDLRGTDGTVGFVYAWDSDNKQAGKGEQEIVGLEEGKRIDHEVRFEKPFISTSYMHFTLEAISDNQTKVTWQFYGKKNFMMKVVHLVLNLATALRKDMDSSLGMLKGILEK